MRPHFKLCALLLLLSVSLYAQTVYTVESIPNVKLIDNSYVSNPDGILSSTIVERINSKLTQLENQTTVQVAVVAVYSIGDADIFNFAQQLFTVWGIGHSKKDNGLLILLVVNQRTVRFHTGYGLEGVLPDALCKEIQTLSMVPSFRNDDYNAGVWNGVEEVVKVLSNESYRDELMDNSRRDANGWRDFYFGAKYVGGLLIVIWYLILYWPWRKTKVPEKAKVQNLSKQSGEITKVSSSPTVKVQTYPEMKLKNTEWALLFGVVPIGLLVAFNNISINTDLPILLFLAVLYIYFILTLIYKRLRMTRVTNRLTKEQNYFAAASFFNDYQVYWLWMAILFPLPALPMYFQYNARKKFFRDHPRNCKSCGQLMQNRLDEKSDDKFLKKNQVFEEELKSVDYDVWSCPSCKSVELYQFVNRFSTYDNCTSCGTKAYFLESDRTVVHATYTSTGTGEKTYRCKFCQKASVTTYTIAMKVESSSSSGSSGGSSGGSWGGGSSGGGGSSSSW